MKTKNLQHFFEELIAKAFNGRDCSRIFTTDFLPRHQIRTNWFAITGPPCAGKTTVLKALENRGFPVIHERGRFVIESALAEGFSTDEIFANQQLLQETILKAKIIAHLENPPQKLTILEDGIPESLAYFGSENLENAGFTHVFDLFRYQKIFFLDALPLQNDPARPHSQEKINQLAKMKKQVHHDMGYEIVRIPVLPVEKRVEKIIKSLGNTMNNAV
jgi:predicted ATPase